jgi:hypothetical protein
MPRPRFSLRGLLLLTACLAVFITVWDRPRRIASRFAAAIEAGDRATADAIYKHGNFSVIDFAQDGSKFDSHRARQSIGDWLLGRCRVVIFARHDDGTLMAKGNVTHLGMTEMELQQLGPSRESGGIPPAP